MNKRKYLHNKLDKVATFCLATLMCFLISAINISDVNTEVLIGYGDANGDDYARWTPKTGWVTQPGHEQDVAEWEARYEALQTGDYSLRTDGQLVPNSQLTTDPIPGATSTIDQNKEFDDIVNLPVGDEYDNACKELKEKDEAQFDKFLDYQQDKALACEHDFIEMSRGSASCIERGFISYECSKCHLLKTDDIESLGHTYKVVEDVAATCTADGYKKSVCEVCGEELLENEVKAAGHTEVIEENPAGLFKNGSCVVKCSTCGEVLKNEIIPQIIPMWAAIVGGILILGIGVFVGLIFKKK